MEMHDYIRFFVALAFVLALMGAAALIGRKAGFGRALTGNSKRLNIIEAKVIDHRNRLILASCDGKEYLFVVGPDSQIVLDTNIAKKPEAA